MIIIRAKRVSGDVAGGSGAPLKVIFDNNDTDDDYYFVGTTTTFYYLQLKFALPKLVQS